MRYWFIFITFFFLPLEITYSQADKLDQTIRLSLSNANPINVISEINRQTGLNLAFESALLNSNQKFSFDGSENKLINVLNKLFSGTETSFSIIANQVIAIKKDPNQKKVQAQVSKSNMSFIRTKAKEAPLEKVETIEIHKVFFDQEEFMVINDSILKANTKDDNAILFYHYEPSSYKSYISNKKLKLDNIASWGITKTANTIELHEKSKEVLNKKRLKASKVKPKKLKARNRKSKIPYNSYIKLEQHKVIQIGSDFGYLDFINQSNTFDEFQFDFNKRNSGFRFNVKYAINNFFACTGFGFQNLHATLTDHGYTSFSDTISSEQVPYATTVFDDYYTISENGEKIWHKAEQTVTEYKTVYDVKNYEKQLFKTNTYDAQYFQIPLSFGYSFKLAKPLRFDTYTQIVYSFSHQRTAFLEFEDDYNIGKNIFKQNYFSYNFGASLELKLGHLLTLYLFGQYNKADIINNTKINSNYFDTSGYYYGFGTSFNIEWYAAPSKYKYR